MITFDPEDTHNIGTIAALVDQRASDFGKWIRRNWDYLPDPLFALRYSSDGKVMYIWSGEDGRAIAEMYTQQTAHYAGRRKNKR